MSEYPKVLVGCPTYDKKEYCRKNWVNTIKAIDYPNFNWVMVDNTKHNRYYHKLLREHPGHVLKSPRGANSRDALAFSSNMLRKKALEEGYDYLLMVEIDLYPPPDVIWRLLRHTRPVVGLPYYIGHGDKKGLCVFNTKAMPNGLRGTYRIEGNEARTFIDGTLKPVHGMGVGCVLIHRDILERFPFWYSTADDDRMKGQLVRKHPDVYFYMDLHNNQVPVFCDTSHVVYHDNSDWATVEDI